MPISCCYGCTPQKRTPYCHGSCPDYIGEVEENKQKKAAEDQKRMVSNAIYYSRRCYDPAVDSCYGEVAGE